MNENTLSVVCGYKGDEHQVRQNLPLYAHHNCPVYILSPEDSRIEIDEPYVKCEFAGKRAYIGQESLDRQHLHLKKMYDTTFDFFLANDSDSFCLAPELPRYLYEEPETLWSNLVVDDVHTHQRGPDYTFPQLALQPPYFFSRAALKKMIDVAPSIKADPITPFIDHYMLQLAVAAGIPYKRFHHCVSCGTTVPETGKPHEIGSKIVANHITEHGAIFIHSIKHIDVVHMCVGLRDQFLKRGPFKSS